MSETIVAVIMAVVFVAIIAWDILLWRDKRQGNTISERMRSWGNTLPFFRMLICFGFGLLAGHWWWASCP